MTTHSGTLPAPERVDCTVDDGFARWLSEARGAVAVSTYQAGKVALASWDRANVTLILRNFEKPMGIAVRDSEMAIVTRDSVVLLADSPEQAPEFPPGEKPRGHDRLYLPRTEYLTGDLDVHDVAFGGEQGDEIWIVNTRFSCLATLSTRYSFVPRWKPFFVTEVVPEDRCHLNGLAMKDARPALVTALAVADTARAWRSHRESGGVLVDVDEQRVVARGLCMPHSPRIDGDRVWLLESGKGALVGIDPTTGDATTVCALPGYARGLVIVGHHALVGLSRARERDTFGGLPIERRGTELKCGVALVNLGSGRAEGMLTFTDGCHEIYDVRFIPKARKPMLLAPRDGVSTQAIVAPDFAYWMLAKLHA